LDFDGHQVTSTVWKSADGASDWRAPAFSLDADPGSFTDAERAAVIEVWRRVSQDFAPFNVDVTTKDPGAEAITRSGSSDTRFGARVLISPDAAQEQCGCGGRAYVNVFARTTSHAYYQPAWVYPQALSNKAKYIAEAASHEAGHTLGLRHDGTTTATYYGGSGGWGPIMGAPYAQAVTQWSDGSYPNANNTEDDIALISANGAPLLADEVGDSRSGAPALLVPGSTTGTLTSGADVDWYAVSVSAGTLSVSVAPYWPGPNADLGLVVTDASGAKLASAAPAYSSTKVQASVGATVTLTVVAGTYFFGVEGTGNGIAGSVGESDYGSLGWYTLTVDGVGVTPTPTPEPSTSSPTPEPSTSSPTPEPSTSSPTPEPTTSSPTPEPSTTSPTPEPSTTSPTPEPSTTSPTPEPSTTSSGPTLDGQSVGTKGTWTARITLRGKPGDGTRGAWTPGGASGSCTIPSGAASCSFDLTGIAKKTASVSYADASLGTATIAKP
jgi:hypothetical protein